MQWWDKGTREKFVDNSLTVGSLVMARLEGWPAWLGIVDDNPDTGNFFSSLYHVIFFDGKEKGEQGLGAGQEVGQDGGGGEGVATDCVRQ